MNSQYLEELTIQASTSEKVTIITDQLSFSDLRIFLKKLAGFPSVKSLFLEGYLPLLPPEVGLLTDLQELYINIVDFESDSLSEELGNLSSLEILSLERMELPKTLPKSIGNLKNLKKIILSQVGVETLPEEIGCLDNLEYLLVSESSLSKIPEQIKNLKSLKFLYLDSPKIYLKLGNEDSSAPIITTNEISSALDKVNADLNNKDHAESEIQQRSRSLWPADSNSNRISLPLLALNGLVALPETMYPLYVGRPLSVEAINQAMNADGLIISSTILQPDEEVRLENLSEVATLGAVVQLIRLEEGHVKVMVDYVDRVKLISLKEHNNALWATIEKLETDSLNFDETPAQLLQLLKTAALSRILKKVELDYKNEDSLLAEFFLEQSRDSINKLFDTRNIMLLERIAVRAGLSTEQNLAILCEGNAFNRLKLLLSFIT